MSCFSSSAMWADGVPEHSPDLGHDHREPGPQEDEVHDTRRPLLDDLAIAADDDGVRVMASVIPAAYQRFAKCP